MTTPRYRWIVWEHDGDNPYRSLYITSKFIVSFWDNGAVHVEVFGRYFRFREPASTHPDTRPVRKERA